MDKDKKVHMKFHARRDATLTVLDRFHHGLDGNVTGLTNRELEVLLKWKGIAVSISKMGNISSK